MLPSGDGDALDGGVGHRVAAGSMDDGEFHSTTCEGLLIEVGERVARLTRLEQTMHAEMAALPTTLEQAVTRLGSTPEAGTSTYGEAVAERTKLQANYASAAKMKCPMPPQQAVQ